MDQRGWLQVLQCFLRQTDGRFCNGASRHPTNQRKGCPMANENEQGSTTQPASKQEERSSQGTGLVRSPGANANARRHQSGQSGLPLTAFEMFRMTPFSLLRRIRPRSPALLVRRRGKRDYRLDTNGRGLRTGWKVPNPCRASWAVSE